MRSLWVARMESVRFLKVELSVSVARMSLLTELRSLGSKVRLWMRPMKWEGGFEGYDVCACVLVCNEPFCEEGVEAFLQYTGK